MYYGRGYFCLTHTVTLSSTRARSCQQSNAYFKCISLESIPHGFGSIAPGCCPSMILQSERENCGSHVKRFFVEIISQTVENLRKFVKLKTLKNLVLYGKMYMHLNVFHIPRNRCMGGNRSVAYTIVLRKSAHPPLWQTCKVLHPWALFHETTVCVLPNPAHQLVALCISDHGLEGLGMQDSTLSSQLK